MIYLALLAVLMIAAWRLWAALRALWRAVPRSNSDFFWS